MLSHFGAYKGLRGHGELRYGLLGQKRLSISHKEPPGGEITIDGRTRWLAVRGDAQAAGTEVFDPYGARIYDKSPGCME